MNGKSLIVVLVAALLTASVPADTAGGPPKPALAVWDQLHARPLAP
jgi:hypothetical protein